MSKGWLKAFNGFTSQLRIQSKEVRSADGKGAKLNPWLSQKMFIETLADALEHGQRSIYVLKSRQLGVTTISLAVDVFWLAAFPGIKGALVVDTDSNSSKFRVLLRQYATSIPEEYRGESFSIVDDNKSFMRFSNGSQIDLLVAGTKNKKGWGESQGFTFAHLTEISKYGNSEEISNFESSFAQESPDRLFIYESTARGMNHWKVMCDEAKRDLLNKRFLFIGWWSKPANRIRESAPAFQIYGLDPPDEGERELIAQVAERYGHVVDMEQLAWYRQLESDTSKSDQTNRQNEPWTEEQAFVLSGFSFFPQRRLQMDMERTDVLEFRGYRFIFGTTFDATHLERIWTADMVHEIQLRIWEDPRPAGQYVIGTDPAWGANEESDRHAISVWRCYADRLVQVAEFCTRDCEPFQATWAYAYLAGAYRNNMGIIELTGGAGKLMMREMDQLRERMRSEHFNPKAGSPGWEDFHSNARWFLYHRPDTMGTGFAYNWETNANTKRPLMDRFKGDYMQDVLEIQSRRLVDEMSNVIQDGDWIGAPDGPTDSQKDDRVIAAALATWAWEEWIRTDMIYRGLTYRAVSEQESGIASAQSHALNGIVFKFMQNQVESAIQREEALPAITERGLTSGADGSGGPNGAMGSDSWMAAKGL